MTRYELLDRIGVGGMAEIFRGKAVAAGGFEKPVAIKRILPHLSQDRRFVELLIAEAKVLSLLKHRNIVQIFDVGLGDDGKYFLVMEFVDGKDLGAIQRALEVQRRRIPFDLVLHMGAEMCEALEHAHVSRGPDGKPMSLVHRDVSPSNVLLSRAGEVKLTDFGIAKRAEQDATQGGAVRGKFAYISPEQARNEHLDPRSDVFSVGILMWELLCNRRLFSGLDDLAALRAVREAPIQRPTEIDPRLPAELDTIIMTALSRDKTRRYATAGVLGTKLRSLRYSLEATVGDPAGELGKIIVSTEEVERQKVLSPPPRAEFDAASESTVIRIRTADAFSADNEATLSAARELIDRFEEEATRVAQLSTDQLRMLRTAAPVSGGPKYRGAVPKPRTRESRESSQLSMDAPTHLPTDSVVDPPPPATALEDETHLARPGGRTPGAQRVPPPPHRPDRDRQPTPGAPIANIAAAPAPAPLLLPVWKSPFAAPPPAVDAPTTQPLAAPLSVIRPWMLVVGAVLAALVSFVVTRAFIR